MRGRGDQPPEPTSPSWSSPSLVLLPEPSGVWSPDPLSSVTEEEDDSTCSSVCVVVPSSSVEVLS
ncbi:hypothetical protein DZG00_06120 [Clavibacter lycopersici]|uniref:Uncharacterized protein n=1 Tax=Clavibacter lycopersici TaxID=2301718 RepID=A0A399T720_9MICO|nr:hypothetical protein DZG00_06120 [Clavibacter lycopersici]RIJ62155.1 hypothetical protein DZG02_03175 [Clavibacter lycopersici]